MRKKLPKRNKLVVILGPTASGKTDLSVALAKAFKGEIVSADSRQIYKTMDVGTAKATKKEMRGIPHYLLNAVKPSQTFTLAQYQRKAVKAIKEIQKRGNIPFLVGGTGLYIKAVVENLKIPKVKQNPALRKKLEVANKEELFKRLSKLDPKTARAIDPHNKRRLVRALEVCLISGKPFSELRTKGKPLFDTLQIGISVARQKLYQRINRRVERQIKTGLIEEVKRLVKKYGWNHPSMSGIGYKEFKPYLERTANLEEAKERLTQNSRRYARRQLTWFRKDKTIHWVKNKRQALTLIKNFLG